MDNGRCVLRSAGCRTSPLRNKPTRSGDKASPSAPMKSHANRSGRRVWSSRGRHWADRGRRPPRRRPACQRARLPGVPGRRTSGTSRSTALPVAADSDTHGRRDRPQHRVHPDFGSNAGYGIPITSSPARRRSVTVSFTGRTSPTPAPIRSRPKPKIEGGSDRHMLLVDKDDCTCTSCSPRSKSATAGTPARARSGTCAPNALRPDGWTSADAAGLPILPGPRPRYTRWPRA